MRFTITTAFAAALLASEVVSATVISRPNHAKLARRMNRQKRCLQRPTVTPNDYHQQATSTSSQVAAPAPTPDNSGNNNNNNNNGNTGGNNGNTGGVGTINAWSDVCGSPNASPNPSQTGGPNGEAIWLTCGISTGGGWSPPPVTRDNVICISLQDALNKPGSPFGACAPYLGSFQSYSAQTGIPETLLASIALQESGCNPGATGPNGEIGMMQITPDKCSGDCYNSDNNIGIGSRYFAGVVDSSGGNLVSAMGQYNGWFPGMTEGDANNHPTCGSRNNLDYLQNVFNGYCQGVDPGSWGVGFYNNIC